MTPGKYDQIFSCGKMCTDCLKTHLKHIFDKPQVKNRTQAVVKALEKGKDNYIPITSLIPYFGRGAKDIFLYRFTDKSVEIGVKYDYRHPTLPNQDFNRGNSQMLAVQGHYRQR